MKKLWERFFLKIKLYSCACNKKDTRNHHWCTDFDLRWNLLEKIECLAQITDFGFPLELLMSF
jgi:hypothetical protein